MHLLVTARMTRPENGQKNNELRFCVDQTRVGSFSPEKKPRVACSYSVSLDFKLVTLCLQFLYFQNPTSQSSFVIHVFTTVTLLRFKPNRIRAIDCPLDFDAQHIAHLPNSLMLAYKETRTIKSWIHKPVLSLNPRHHWTRQKLATASAFHPLNPRSPIQRLATCLCSIW